MGDTNNNEHKSRRWFLSLFKLAEDDSPKNDKVKMLTADGKLVEVDKAVLDAASKKIRSTNKEIYAWMNNPSKDKK